MRHPVWSLRIWCGLVLLVWVLFSSLPGGLKALLIGLWLIGPGWRPRHRRTRPGSQPPKQGPSEQGVGDQELSEDDVQKIVDKYRKGGSPGTGWSRFFSSRHPN